MSYTENKLNSLRRLLLGPLFDECKNSPYGVSRLRIEEHINSLKEEGCIGDCSVDDFVKMCQMKSHIPSCYNEKDRGCVEGWFGKQKGIATVAFNNYKNAKYFEDMADDDEDKDDEKECGVCGLDEDLEENYGTEAEGYKEEFKKLEKMSCGHYSHKACLIKVAKGLNKNNAFCPLCKVKFPITEVPMPILTREQKRQNDLLKQIKDGLATGMTLKGIADMNLTTISRLIDGLVMNTQSFAQAIGMSEEELENEMYSAGDAYHPRVIKKYYNETGKVKEEYEVRWDEDTPIKHGYYKTYYYNGDVNEVGNYKHGKKDGEWKEFFKGVLEVENNYKNGKKVGTQKEWSGDLISQILHFNDEGQFEYGKTYHPNGMIHVIGGPVKYSDDGEITGKLKRYNDEGKLIEEIDVNDINEIREYIPYSIYDDDE